MALTWESEAFTASEIGAPGSGWVRTGTKVRRCLARRKVELSIRDHWRDLLEPLSALVRGTRT